jgi:hypothetical protein
MAHQIAHVLRFTHSPTRRFSDSALWAQPLALSSSKRSEDPACCEAAAGHWEKAMIQGTQKPRFSKRDRGFCYLKSTNLTAAMEGLFKEKMTELSVKLYKQFAKENKIEATIKKNLEVLDYGE